LRDGDPKRYGGKGVQRAVATPTEAREGGDRAQDRRPRPSRRRSTALCECDGTETKSRLGANALLGVSLAAAHAAANAAGLPLYRFLDGSRSSCPRR